MVTTARSFDLRDDAVTVDTYVETGPLPANGYVRLTLTSISGNQLEIAHESDELVLVRMVDTLRLELGRLPFDAVAHRWWRIARTGDDITWETSADGMTFVQRSLFPGLTWATFMRVNFLVGAPVGVTPFTVAFDHFNGGASSGEACQTFALADDFEDGEIAEQWEVSSSVASLDEVGGELVISVVPFQQNYGALISRTLHDLRDDAITVEVPQVLNTTEPGGVHLVATTFAGEVLELREERGMLDALRNSTRVGNSPYDSAATAGGESAPRWITCTGRPRATGSRSRPSARRPWSAVSIGSRSNCMCPFSPTRQVSCGSTTSTSRRFNPRDRLC
ncbi:MAG: hypothetical protein H0T42_00615 [Deltaproteobacteria bacterium]|nr:hypothetical protein [Deltaproteobacteria bacterium]